MRRAFAATSLTAVRESKGLTALGLSVPDDPEAYRRTAFDRVANVLEAHVDMSRVAAFAGLDWKREPRPPRNSVESAIMSATAFYLPAPLIFAALGWGYFKIAGE